MNWRGWLERFGARPAPVAEAELLFASTDYDSATGMLAEWARKAHDKVAVAVPRAEHIRGRTLSQNDLTKRLCNETRAVLFYGHGRKDRLVGRPSGAAVLDIQSSWVKGRAVIAVACWTASDLGRRLVEDRLAPLFVGYGYELLTERRAATWLGEAANAFATAYFSAERPPARDALNYAQTVYDSLIDQCMRLRKERSDAAIAIGLLMHNRDGLQLWDASN